MKFKEIFDIFEDKLKSKEYKDIFGFACFFGSFKLKEDLDFFVIPNENVKKGQFLKKLILFLEDIKEELKNKGEKLVIINHSTFEEETKYINKIQNKQADSFMYIHVSSFDNIHPFPISSLLKKLKKSEDVLLRDPKLIDKIKETKLDYYYNYLFIANCLFSNYPKELIKKKISNKVEYIYKHVSKKEKLKSNPREIYFQCCDFLDKHAY